MQHIYELLINLKKYSEGKSLVGKKGVLTIQPKYNRQHQVDFSDLLTHSYPDKLGIKPRDEKLWAWVRAGVEIMFPPTDHKRHEDLYQSLYACQTNLVILNAIADDIADNFRDQQFLDQILSVFPKELSSSYFIQQNIDGEPIELSSKENVEYFLRTRFLKIQQILKHELGKIKLKQLKVRYTRSEK